MNDARAALVCARRYLRSGKRRQRDRDSAACMTALYDALLFGMRYYILRHKTCARFVTNADVWDATALYRALTRAGVFDDPLLFNRLTLIVERALWQPSYSFDVEATVAEAERVLAKLGVFAPGERIRPRNQ